MPDRRSKLWVAISPLLLLYFVTLVIPLIILIIYSFFKYAPPEIIPKPIFTLENYAKFFKDVWYGGVLVKTTLLSLITTLFCLVLGYTLAYYIAGRRSFIKSVLLTLVILPLITGSLVQTLGWYAIFSNSGPVNNILKALRVIWEPLPFLGSEVSIVIGLIQAFLPYMMFPILNSIETIPQNLKDAAASLGANNFIIFFRITLPLSINGIMAGCLLVFASSLSSYVTPSILGQGKIPFISMIIYQQALQVFNWPFASVLAIVLLFGLAVLFGLGRCALGLLNRMGR